MKLTLFYIGLIMVIISAFVSDVVAEEGAMHSEAQHRIENSVTILCYHIIAEVPKSRYDVSMKAFKEQIDYLIKNKYNFYTIEQLVSSIKQGKLAEKGVVVTIDDGDVSSYTVAFRIAKQYKIPFTFCLYTSRIGKNRGSLSWEQIKEMVAAGMEIASHTNTHPHLTPPKKESSWKTLSEKEIKKELEESKAILGKQLNIKIKYLCYPYGLYNDNVEKLAVRSGYEAMLTLDWGANKISTNPLRLKRKMLTSSISLKEFIKLLK